MTRTHDYIHILKSIARFQQHISVMLEAKVLEAEKSRDWICTQLRPSQDDSEDKLHKQSLEIHQEIIEVIDGLTKMEQALARNLKVLLGQEESASGIPDLFGQNGGDMT